MSATNDSKVLVIDTTLLAGDKGSISLGEDDILIHVNTSESYRIVIYKLDNVF